MNENLKKIANNIRINIIKSVSAAKSGHPGGSLSITDILTALYFEKMNIDPKDPKNPNRDRFVLSKGHSAPALYATLAESGYFPQEELVGLRKYESKLQGHPDMKKIIGVDMSTGSLGQGLSAANGMALAGKLDESSYRVYAILGDGEVQEGQIWEAAMSSAHYKLDNLTVFLDLNGLQIDGSNEEVMSIGPVDEKFKSFGWNVLTINGHCFEELIKAIDEAAATKGKPTMIVCNTVKGKGVSFMENNVAWHGSAPNEEQTMKALAELEGGVR